MMLFVSFLLEAKSAWFLQPILTGIPVMLLHHVHCFLSYPLVCSYPGTEHRTQSSAG